ncbi:MAG TPA: DNA cytosine methyltransferase [Polyangiaceae bacterium]|nr:DNA cytosine methyltransferase [Polyangiaceae bacterium]
MADEMVFRVACSFGGGGGGALGFARARARLFGVGARFDLAGGFDKDAYACRAFEYLTGAPQANLDARELTPSTLRELFGESAPFAVFGSPPCQGASRLLSEKKSREAKYVALNELVLEHTRLVLDAWPGRGPALILYENVPSITSRAKGVLAEVRRLLTRAGYVLQDGYHECRFVGGLAQWRKRWFCLARDPRQVPAYVYLPPQLPGKVCGDVLSPLPPPGSPEGGPMHRLPAISFLNWLRLWAIPPGGDWRDLLPDDGTPRRARFRRHHVQAWGEPSSTVGGSGSNGPCAVAVPLALNLSGQAHHNLYRVTGPGEPSGTVTGARRPGQGAPSYAQPLGREWFKGALGVLAPGEAAGTVSGNAWPMSGRYSVAAPVPLAPAKACFDKAYAVLRRDEPSHAVAGTSAVGCGTYAVADELPLGCAPRAGAYGVVRPDEASPAVSASACIDNGAVAYADPRPAPPPFVVVPFGEARRIAGGEVPVPFALVDPSAPGEPLAIVDDLRRPPFRWAGSGKRRRREPVPVVLVTAGGAWHRPLTTLELARLQDLPAEHGGKALDFGGGSTDQRGLIGNMVPPGAARAIAEQALLAGVASANGGFFLTDGGRGIWVEPERRALLEALGVRRVRPGDLAKVKGEPVILDDGARRLGPKARPRKGRDLGALLGMLRAARAGSARGEGAGRG